MGEKLGSDERRTVQGHAENQGALVSVRDKKWSSVLQEMSLSFVFFNLFIFQHKTGLKCSRGEYVVLVCDAGFVRHPQPLVFFFFVYHTFG